MRTYSNEAIEELASACEISDLAQIDDVRHRLEGAALVYRIYKQNADKVPRPGKVRAAVDEIRDLAKKLLRRLETLDDTTAQVFWCPETELRGLIWQPEVTQTRFGHTVHRRTDENGFAHPSYLEREDLFEALRIIQGYCAEVRSIVPEDKGGPRKSEALLMWVVNVEKIWEEVFHRAFTLDYEKGRPVSDAAIFAVEAFKPVDQKVPSSRVMNAMKTLIASRRKLRAGKNPFQN